MRMLLVEWMEQSVPAWMRIMVLYVTSVLSPRCEYLMEIRAHCMFLYLCRESGDKSTPLPPAQLSLFPPLTTQWFLHLARVFWVFGFAFTDLRC